jgi:hypothetical protein
VRPTPDDSPGVRRGFLGGREDEHLGRFGELLQLHHDFVFDLQLRRSLTWKYESNDWCIAAWVLGVSTDGYGLFP